MQHSNTKNHFTVTAITYNPSFKLLLMPPGCGSQWILSAPPQPTWGTNNILIYNIILDLRSCKQKASKHHDLKLLIC